MKKKSDILMQNKAFAYLALLTAVVLFLPYLAMKFKWVKPDLSNPADRGVDWTRGDFVLMGILIFGMGSLFIYLARVTPRKYRIFIALGVLAAFLLIWVHLAVGIVDTWPFAGS
jgi:membrane protease YdiL (CAAX protease family)